MTCSKQTLSSCDRLKRLKTYPPAYMHTDTVSATGGPYFRKERAFTRMREARSRVPAAVQRQHSIVGSARTWARTRASCQELDCLLSHPALGQTFSPASPPPSVPLTFPDPGVGEWVGVRRGEAPPEPAFSQSPSCYSDVLHNKAKRSGASVAAKDRGEGKRERERRSSRRREAEWQS